MLLALGPLRFAPRAGGTPAEEKVLAIRGETLILQPFGICGLVAQLEERRNGIAEVVSSNLIGSTILRRSAAEAEDALRRLGEGGRCA